MGGLSLMGGGYAPTSTAESLALLAAFISSVNIAGESPAHVDAAQRYLPLTAATSDTSYSNRRPAAPSAQSG